VLKSKNVVSLATKPEGAQGWICQVCGGCFYYSQPIGFGLQLTMLKAFMDAHIHDAPVSPTPEPGPSVLTDMLAYAQQCTTNAPTLEPSHVEQLQLAADVLTLGRLLMDLRLEASGSTPQCLNLEALNRRIRGIVRQPSSH
jgi:hypothetical protein